MNSTVKSEDCRLSLLVMNRLITHDYGGLGRYQNERE